MGNDSTFVLEIMLGFAIGWFLVSVLFVVYHRIVERRKIRAWNKEQAEWDRKRSLALDQAVLENKKTANTVFEAFNAKYRDGFDEIESKKQ